MKDGLEVAEGVRTASSATNGDSCDAMRPSDEQRPASNGLDVDTTTLPANGPSKNGAGPPKPPANGKSFTCGTCNRGFSYKHVLQNHERTHTGEKPFECPECHKRFTRDHHLKTHMRLHTGEKPYQCPHCDRHFVQVANLRRHLRVHTGERPYPCTLCESRFSDSNQLKAHTLIHLDEKPFQCPRCLGRFRRRHHLIHHKCPKDESNLGKPRRGRRPKAYEHRHHEEEDQDEDEEELLVHISSDNEENISIDNNNIDSSPEPVKTPPPVVVHPIGTSNGLNGDHHLVKHNVDHHLVKHNVDHHLVKHNVDLHPLVKHNGDHHPVKHNGDHHPLVKHNGDHHHHHAANNNRRKPSRTIRILTPQQRELFLRDKVTMQTQAIDMSLSQPVTVIVPNRFLEDGVLDLSSSRSDSEVELVEPVCASALCPCSLHDHFARRRPLSQRIANQRNGTKILEPLRMAHSSGSDDSNESHMTAENGHHCQNGHNHLHHNGHMSEEEDSIGAIPLTTKKTHLAATTA